MNEAFNCKNFYSEISRKLRYDQELSLFDITIIFKGLLFDKKLQGIVNYILENGNAKTDTWITRVLNDYYLFAPVYDDDEILGFKVEERTKDIEERIEKLAQCLFKQNSNENE